jgi:hypothetical protein
MAAPAQTGIGPNGVRSLLHLDLRSKSADIAVDIFDMGTADTAFVMYADERSPDEPYISIGAEGYSNKGALNFFQDRFYVKLQGFRRRRGQGTASACPGDFSQDWCQSYLPSDSCRIAS